MFCVREVDAYSRDNVVSNDALRNRAVVLNLENR
jgi:hypothetical protein